MMTTWEDDFDGYVGGGDYKDFGSHTSRSPALRGPSCLQKSIMSFNLITEANSAFSDTPNQIEAWSRVTCYTDGRHPFELLRPSGRPDGCLGSATYLDEAVVIKPIIEYSQLKVLGPQENGVQDSTRVPRLEATAGAPPRSSTPKACNCTSQIGDLLSSCCG